MKYSKDEVMQYVQEEDVKFIRLAFCDVFGKQKNIAIMQDELPRAFEYGISFDASAIAGFGDETHSDLLLHPRGKKTGKRANIQQPVFPRIPTHRILQPDRLGMNLFFSFQTKFLIGLKDPSDLNHVSLFLRIFHVLLQKSPSVFQRRHPHLLTKRPIKHGG